MYKDYLNKLVECLHSIRMYGFEGIVSDDYEQGMQKLIDLFSRAKIEGKRVFFIGNGGSAAIASHMTADFMKNGGMKTYSLYDNSVTTCMGNDYGYEYVFSRPLELLADKEDLLAAISSSGNSQNIVNAIQTAQQKGLNIVTFSGFKKDNRIINMGSYNVHVPVEHYGIVESIHNLILQQIVDMILERDGVCL